MTGVRLREGAAPFDLNLEPGKITVVLGGNDAGKTNLCRLLAGLHCSASGTMRLGGESLDTLPTRQRPVAMVYQAFVNYPNLTVAQNIGSPLRAQGKQGIEARVQDLAERLRISELLQRFPHELSGGQQQRVAIARALAKDAPILLLDEPLVNLDFKLREALEQELRELLVNEQKVIVYTSSDQRDAFTLADHVVLLAGGRLVQQGPAMQLYSAPADVTAMSLLADAQLNPLPGQDNTWVRAEHLLLENADLDFEMQVLGVETNGLYTYLHGAVDEHEWVARVPGLLSLQPGARVTVGVRSEDVVRFHG